MAQLGVHIFLFLRNDPIKFLGPCTGLGFSVAPPEKQQFANVGEGGEKKLQI